MTLAEPPRRLHALSPFLSLIDRQLLLAPGALALGPNGLRLLVAGLLVVLAARVIRWWRRTWVLADGVLRVESGVFARRQQLVSCDRIQQVTIVQKVRQRVLGMATLRVEVAGGGDGGGVDLEVLAVDEATRLREALLVAKATAPAAAAEIGEEGEEGVEGTAGGEPAWVPAPWPVVELSFAQLALAGVTGGQLLVVFVFAGSLFQLADDLPGRPWQRISEIEVGPVGPALTALLVLAFVVVWLGSAVAASVLRDAGYRLSLVGQELHLSRGLLDRKEAVLPLARVQAVRVSASPLRRALGYVSLRLQGAGSGSDHEERRLFVPLLPVAALEGVLSLVLPGLDHLPALAPSPPAALRRSVVRCAVLPSVVALALAVLVRPWGVLAVLWIPLALALGVAAYRALGHGSGTDVIVARRGALVRRTTVVPIVRAQSVRVRSSPFQRRAGLATVLVDLAGPGVTPRATDVSAATASALGRRVTAGAGAATVTPSAP